VTSPVSTDPALVATSTKLGAARLNLPRSAASFLAMMAGLVVIKILVARWMPGAFASPSQAQVFSWTWIAALTALGLVGVWFASRTGFPETWDPAVPLRDRLLLPIVTGVILGAIAMVVDALTGWTALVAQQMHLPSIHIHFPASLFIYTGGALIVNILYYLVPIPLLLWLVSLVLRGRYSQQAFWVVGVLAALLEPLSQDLGLPGHPGIMVATFAQDLALNLAQVMTFRRAGFGASVVLRVTFYLLWHALWGALRG
jgi:hypothetical protein